MEGLPTDEDILAAGPLKTIELLHRNKKELLELINIHIRKLNFNCMKYRTMEGVMENYCNKIEEFEVIYKELEHLLERDHL